MSTDVDDRPADGPDQEALEAEFHAPAQRPPTSWEVLRDRFLIPILLPVLVTAIVVLFAVNVSRFFLASASHHDPTSEESVVNEEGAPNSDGTEEGGDDKSVKQPGPVIVITILTAGALIGAVLVSAAKRLRPGPAAIIVGGVIAFVFIGGQIVYGFGEPEGESAGGYVEPEGDPVATLEIDALPSNQFNASSFTTPAGINEIKYVGKGGSHTLVFENAFPGFELAVNGVGVEDSAKVEFLEEGASYVVFCTIAGHRQAGMEATITIGAAAPGGDAAADGDASTTTAG